MTAATPSAPTRAQLEHEIARFLLDLLPAGRPRRLARMSRPGELRRDGTPRDKYQDIGAEQLTLAMLAEHARGRVTYSYTLDKDGQARQGTIDTDEGGQPPLLALLRAAAELGVIAFAVENDAGGAHKGGHFVALFDDFYPAEHIKALMNTIAERAGVSTKEIWPGCNQGLRGLFGFHQVDQTRGKLLLPNGEIISLDLDLAAGFAAVRALPLNSAPPALEHELSAIAENRPAAAARPAAAQHISQAQPRQARPSERASLDDVKAKFNAEHAPDQLLLDYGAVQTSSKDFTCPFCKHSHTNTLFIFNGRIYSRSPGCIVPQKKGLDSFGLYCKVEHNDDSTAAAKKLNPIQPRKRQAEQPPLVEQPTRQRTPAQIADAERKRKAQAAETAEIRATVEQRAQQDDRLTPCDRATLAAMLGWAAERNSSCCWLGRAAIAARSGYSLGSVKRSVMQLEALGYFESTGAGGRPIDTAKRNFACGSSLHPETIFVANDDPRKILASDHDLTQVACEGGPAPQPPAPVADRALLGYVRALAKEAAESGWELRDYDALDQVALEHEAARLEQLLCPAAEPHQVEYQGGAGYSAPAVEPAGEYTGRPKDLADFETLCRWSSEAIKVRALVDEPAQAEQQQLDEAPPSSAGLQACPPAPSDPRYREFAWRWNAAQQEWRTTDQRAFFKRQALLLCDYAEPSEAARRWLAFKRPPAPLGRPGAALRAPSRAQRPKAAPNPFAGQQSLFDVPRGVAAD